MRATPARVLGEAARDQHANETFEKALGRVVKEHQGTYRDYIELIGKVRLRSKKERTTLGHAAKLLAAES